MNFKAWIYRLIASLAAATLVSCATPPEWITAPPPDSAGAVYFTGIGSDSAGNAGKAEVLAAKSMVAEITRYIGVRITADTSVETRATVEAYEAEVIERIQERSSALVSDFRIVDRHVESFRDGSVNVYLLGAYDSEALAAEKERFARILLERFEALAGPEREGDSLRDTGDLFRAAVKYLESAAAAFDSDVENSNVIFERVVKKATDSVSLISIEPQSAPVEVRRGVQPEDFAVLVSGPSGPIAGAALSVTWNEQKISGGAGTATEIVRSSPAGRAVFAHPVPEFAGEGITIFALVFTPQLEALRAARGKARDLVRGFERASSEKTVEFRFSIGSVSQKVPTAVFLVEILNDGVISSSTTAGDEMQASLNAAGYDVVAMDTGGLVGPDLPSILAAVREGASAAHRVAFGTVNITQVSTDNGVYLARAEGSVSFVSVATGDVVLSLTGTGLARGRSSESAVNEAFRNTGAKLGYEAARRLP